LVNPTSTVSIHFSFGNRNHRTCFDVAENASRGAIIGFSDQ